MYNKFEENRQKYFNELDVAPNDVNILLGFIKTHSDGPQNPDQNYKPYKRIIIIRRIVASYHKLLKYKDSDFVRNLFLENELNLLSWAFENKRPSANDEDKATSRYISEIFKLDLEDSLKKLFLWIDLQKENPIFNWDINVFALARAFCFNNDYDIADRIVTNFIPDCYSSAPNPAIAFIDALVWHSNKYEILCKHLPWGLKVSLTPRPGIEILGFFNKIESIGAELSQQKIPDEYRIKIGRIFWDFAYDYLFDSPEFDFKHEYLSSTLRYAMEMNTNTRKEVRGFGFKFRKKGFFER